MVTEPLDDAALRVEAIQPRVEGADPQHSLAVDAEGPHPVEQIAAGHRVDQVDHVDRQLQLERLRSDLDGQVGRLLASKIDFPRPPDRPRRPPLL